MSHRVQESYALVLFFLDAEQRDGLLLYVNVMQYEEIREDWNLLGQSQHIHLVKWKPYWWHPLNEQPQLSVFIHTLKKYCVLFFF